MEQGDLALEHNPFHVLDVPTSASRAQVLRQKHKLLGLLTLKLSAGRAYTTPLGTHERTDALVRSAACALDDPRQRLMWELWTQREPVDEEHPFGAVLHAAVCAHYDLHRHVAADAPVSKASFDDLCHRWDRALDNAAFRRSYERRARALGVAERRADRHDEMTAFARSVRARLVPLLAATRFDLGDLDSVVGKHAASRYRRRAIDRIELSCRQLSDIGPWQQRLRAWIRLKTRHQRSIAGRGDHLGQLAFTVVRTPLNKLAEDAFEARYLSLAHELYSWLCEHAVDDETSARCAYNAQLCANMGPGRMLATMAICRHCDACVNDRPYCAHCGNRMRPAFCTQCGTPVERTFCTACGTRSHR